MRDVSNWFKTKLCLPDHDIGKALTKIFWFLEKDDLIQQFDHNLKFFEDILGRQFDQAVAYMIFTKNPKLYYYDMENGICGYKMRYLMVEGSVSPSDILLYAPQILSRSLKDYIGPRVAYIKDRQFQVRSMISAITVKKGKTSRWRFGS